MFFKNGFTWFLGGCFLFLVGLLTYNAWFQAYHFDVYPFDGGFQLYNPLRRLAAGQLPGQEGFQYFHGFGLIFLHLPLFFLAGGNLFASEFSRWETAVLLLALAGYGFYRGLGLARWVAFTCCILLFVWSLLAPLDPWVFPNNSIRGGRFVLPFLSFGLFAWLLTYRPDVLKKKGMLESVGALTTALSIFCGVDQGLFYGGAFLAFLLIYRIVSFQGWRSIVSPFLYLGLSAFFLWLVTWVSSGFQLENAEAMLRYNLLEVPLDQIWYFGVPPNAVVYDWPHWMLGDRRLLLEAVLRSFGLMALIIVMAFINTPVRFLRKDHAALLLGICLYGILSCLVNLSYFWFYNGIILFKTQQIVGLSVLFLGVKAGWPWLQKKYAVCRRPVVLRLLQGAAAMALVVTFLLPATQKILQQHNHKYAHRFSGETTSYSGVVLSQNWTATLKQLQTIFPTSESLTGPLWSTYAGLLEDYLTVYHPYRDYIIHALGPRERATYLHRFKTEAPTYAVTVRPDFAEFEAWLQGTTWPFYETLLLNYDFWAQTPYSVIWKKRSEAEASTSLPQDFSALPFQVLGQEVLLEYPEGLTPQPNSILLLEISYRVDNPWQSLPVLGKLPRVLFNINYHQLLESISLPPAPYPGKVVVPVFWKPDVVPSYELKVFPPLPDVSVTLETIRYQVLRLSPQNYQAIEKSFTRPQMGEPDFDASF
jgi:hypothetical protein